MGVKVTLTFPAAAGVAAEAAARSAIKDVVDVCLEDANRTVPLEEGPLQASGTAQAAGLEGQVSYATPYAVVQHEDTSLNHYGQGRAQWLELTVYENQERYAEYVAAKVAAAMGG